MMTDSSPIILDTHTWIWLAHQPEEIAKTALPKLNSAFDNDLGRISIISVWELAVLHRKNRIRLTSDLKDWIRKSTLKLGLEIIPLSTEICLASEMEIETATKDPADKLILATAMKTGFALATRDKQIIETAKILKLDVLTV